MNVWMVQHVLPPAMQHAHEADVSTQVLGIGSYLQQCGRAGSEQKIVYDFLVRECERRKLMRQREHDMDVRHIQQFLFAGSEPLVTSIGLALGAMAVTACNGELSITCLMGSLS
jgi:hypothetical protein